MNRLDGKHAVITGASRGIGAAAAKIFAEAGAQVTLLARDGATMSVLADDIGEQAQAIATDVSDYTALSGGLSQAEATFGPVDILINNAGIIDPIASIATAEPAAWSRNIDINLKGVFYGMRAVLGAMMARGAGTVITVSSGAAHHPLEGWSSYCAAKAGAAMLTRSAHLEAGAAGVRVMGLSPGTVATEMQVKIRRSGINPVSQLDPSIHIPAEWPARALLWMCSDDADEYCGEEISLRDEGIRRRIGLTA